MEQVYKPENKPVLPPTEKKKARRFIKPASLRRLIKSEGGILVAEEATKFFAQKLTEKAEEITKKAIEIAKKSGLKRVTANQIREAERMK